MSDHCPHCGGVLEAEGKPRSHQDHKRFFAMIDAAFHHWPHSHEFEPDSSEHLRSWLLCKANYRTNTLITIDDPAHMQQAMRGAEAALNAAGTYAFIRPARDGCAVVRAKSIHWQTLGQQAFGKLREDVETIIHAELGMSGDQLLDNHRRAA